MIQTLFADFARAFEAGKPSLVATTLVADLETPVSAFLKLTASRASNVFLLESVEGGAARGRYSMIGMDPDIVWRASGDECEINRNALHDADAFERLPVKPLDGLRALIAESRIDADALLPPMAAGVFGYMGYDMVRQMEQLPAPKPDPIGLPDAVMIRPTLMVVFDSVRDEMSIVTPVRPQAGADARGAWESAQARLDAVVAVLESPLAHKTAAHDHIFWRRRPSPTPARRAISTWWSAQRNTFARATCFRWCSRSASPRRFSCPPSRCFAPCAV